MRSFIMTACAMALSSTGVLFPQQTQAQTLSAVGSEEYGRYIVGPDGRPVYAFLTSTEMGGDGQDPINSCNVDDCRKNWQLVTAEGEVTLGDALLSDLLDTQEVDGETVVRYGDHPLFYFVRDAAGAPPQGQGIYSYGGYWALVTPSGHAIKTGPMEEKDEILLVPKVEE